MAERRYKVTPHSCLAPSCQKTFGVQDVAYYIYTHLSENLPSDSFVIDDETLDETLSSLEHISRIHTENDFVETPYLNESDIKDFTEHEPSALIKLCFCKYHAPCLATAISDRTKTKIDILGQSTEISDEVRSIVIDWNNNNQKIKQDFDAAPDNKKANFTHQYQNLDLSYVVFPSTLDLGSLDTSLDGHSQQFFLKGCYFEKKATLSKTSIDHLVVNKSRFLDEAAFWLFVARVGADFKQCIFYDRATFRGAKFKGNPSYFDESIFHGWTEFENVAFDNQIWFIRCKFEGKGTCHFDLSSFKSDACFNGAEFNNVSFNRAIFRDGASFNTQIDEKATKFKAAYFRNTRFDRGGNFEGAEFGEVNFNDTIFSGTLNFKEITVQGKAFFDYTGDADSYFGHYYGDKYKDWPEGDFFNWVSFENSKFLGFTSFQNRTFRHTCSFRNVQFKQAPRFEGSELHPNTDFYQTQFEDKSSDSSIRSYRYLKRQMEKVGAKTEENLFFGLEQNATLNLYGSHPAIWKRKGNTAAPDLIHLLLLVLYKWSADFGRSPLRTMSWIFLNLLMSSGLYNFFFYPCDTYSKSLLWGMKTILKPFSTLDTEATLALGVLTAVYGIIQIILLIMLGFAIRRRMGIK